MPGRRDSKASSIPSSRGSVSSEDNFHRRVSWVSEGSDMQIDHIEALNDLGGDEELDDLTKATTSVSRGSRGSRGSGRGSRGSARSSLMGSIFGSKKGKKGRRGSGRSSLSSRSSQNISSFWSDLAAEKDLWDDDDDDEGYSCGQLCVAFWETRFHVLKQNCSIICKNPKIILLTFLVFLAFCGALAVLINILAEGQREDIRQERMEQQRSAIDLAESTGKFFSDQLDQAILPLFSIAQFVQQLEIFQDMPNQIGAAGEPGSLPFKPWKELNKTSPTHREADAVCNDPDVVSRFNEIASTIKKNSKMERVLVNVQLAPQAMVCLLYPKNNTEDFDYPVYMDNSGAVGHDLITDPNRKFIAEATVPVDDVVIAGPLSLVQCYPDCPTAVEQAFIARLSISVPGKQYPGLLANGTVHNKWGFAVVLINWKELVDRSGVYERFEKEGNKFQLTRTDQKYDKDTDTYFEKVAVLAESEGYEESMGEVITAKLDTTNNEWEMHVKIGGYEGGLIDLDNRSFHDNYPPWEYPAYGVAIGISALFAFLFMTILIEKRLNKNVLQQLLPGKSLQKVSRGKTVVEKFDLVTVYFSDIVGYTSMSVELRPIQVMKMLNEFYTEMDKIADKHGVYKMETIGDAYMVTGGVPDRCSGPEGAAKVALFAIEAMEFTKNFKTSDGLTVKIRGGINSGPLVAGVVGNLRPKYTIFGDTVNVASRMESNSLEGRVQVSESTYFQLQQSKEYDFEYEDRGLIPIKGKGEMHTWFVDSATKVALGTAKKIKEDDFDNIYLKDIDEEKRESARPLIRLGSDQEIDVDSDSFDSDGSTDGEQYFA